MLTLLTTPKAFRDHIGIIQRNAIHSWTLLRPACEIVILGDDEGAAEIAAAYRLRHVPQIARNEYGTPLVNDLFAKGEQIATHDIVCYINSDIILMSDFVRAVQGVARLKHRFLMVGQRCNIDVTQPLDFNSGWEEQFRSRLMQNGSLGDLTAIDYFVFPRGLWGEIPPFALGRTMWDDWLLSRALARDAILIDATPVIVAAHQNHDYSAKPEGWKWIWEGPEAQRNCELAGGRGELSSLRNATHFLTPHGLEFAYERLHLSSFLNALRIVHPSLRLPVNLALKAIAAARPLSAWKRRMFPTGLPLFRIRER